MEMEKDILNKIMNIQYESKFKLSNQQEIFKLLDNLFVTMPLMPGILNEPYQRPPIICNNDSSQEEYKKYKERGQKYKRIHFKCEGWNKNEVLNSYPIDPDTDKIGGCTGNKSRNGKLKYIVVDIDDFTKFKNNAYGNLEVGQWPPTLISLSGGGCHLFYSVNVDSIELKSKSLNKTLGIEIIANGKYNVLPGSIHPMTHTIYTIAQDHISPYLPEAALHIAPAPDILLKIITDGYDVNINSKNYVIKNKELCNISEYICKPKPIILSNYTNFVDLNKLNDLVSPPVPNYDEIKFCYDNGYLEGLDISILNSILPENKKLKIQSYHNHFKKKAMDIKPLIEIQNQPQNDASIKTINQNNQNILLYQNDNTDNLTNKNANNILNIDSKLRSLPKNIYDLIINPPNIDRSAENQKVIVFLVIRGWSDNEIKYIFNQYPIGQKNLEKNNNDKYIDISIYNAKEYVKKNKLEQFYDSNASNKEGIEVYSRCTLKDVIKNTTLPQYIISHILSKREKLLLGAGPGCLKSTFILQLCIELIDTDCKFLYGHYQINDEFRPNKILYVNGENSDDQIKQKLHNLFLGYPIDYVDNILEHIVILLKNDICDFYDDFNNEHFINYICQSIEEEKINLVIFDNFSCYNTDDENSNAIIRTKLNKVSFISSKYKIPAIIVHHSGKSNDDNKKYALRGASAFMDWGTLILWIKRGKDPHEFILSMLKSRNEEISPDVNLKYEGKRLYCPDGQFNSNCNDNKINETTILINVMKNNNGVYNTQEQLKKDLSIELSNNKLPFSAAKCKKIIEIAKSKGILNVTKGPNNSSIINLNSTYNN